MIDPSDGTNSYDYSDTDLALVKCFKIDHPTATEVTTKEQILTLVNISPEFRKWYIEWKELRNIRVSKPDFIGNTRQELIDWDNLRESLQEAKENEKNWQNEINVKSKELRDLITNVEKRKTEYYKKVNPLLIISRVSVNQLPKENLISIALEGDVEKRQIITEELVLMFKKKLYSDLRKGVFKNPMEK